MGVFGKSAEQVTETDLWSLVKNEVRESQQLDFKRDPYAPNDDGKREMLRDIAAMANAFGGEILLGIDESGDGVASEVVGISEGEQVATSIVSSCLNNIDERVNVRTWPIPLKSGRQVVLIQIPQSLRSPHMITFRGLNQFWRRHDRQKSPMSSGEIREACVRGEMLAEKLERFLDKEAAAARGFEPNVPMIAVSLTPLLVQRTIVNVGDMKVRCIIRDSRLNDGFLPRPCLAGLEVERLPGARIRLHRNGHLAYWETLEGYLQDYQPHQGEIQSFLKGGAVVETMIKFLRLAKAMYEHLETVGPFFGKLDLWGVQGVILRTKAASGFEPGRWLETDLHLEPIELETIQEPVAAAKLILDRLWQAFGHLEAPVSEA